MDGPDIQQAPEGDGGDGGNVTLTAQPSAEAQPPSDAGAGLSGPSNVVQPAEPLPLAAEEPRLRVIPRNPQLFREAKDDGKAQEAPPPPGRKASGRPSKGGSRAVRTLREKLAKAHDLAAALEIVRAEAERAGLDAQDLLGESAEGGAQASRRNTEASEPAAPAVAAAAPAAPPPAPLPPAPPETIMGVPRKDVERWAPITNAVAFALGTKWSFLGEVPRRKFFEGLPCEFEAGGDLAGQLAENGAAYMGRKWPLAAGGAAEVDPGRALLATVAAIAIPRALPAATVAAEWAVPRVRAAVQRLKAKVRRRFGR